MATFCLDLAYSYHRFGPPLIGAATGDDSATLARIEALLVEAADQYRARRFLAAIASYTRVRELIWSQLAPTTKPGDFEADGPWLRPLISYGAEWMNVLPVEQATKGVRPREELVVDAEQLVGLRSAKVSTEGVRAAADLAQSATLARQGNTVAAQFFRERALGLSSELVETIEAPTGRGDVGPRRLTGVLDHRAALAHAGMLEHVPLEAIYVPPAATVDQRTYSFKRDGVVTSVAWADGGAAAVDDLIDKVYRPRIGLRNLPDVLLAPQRPADLAVGLAHSWYYETPLGLAECHHGLGEWATAESWYDKAAGYEFLNATVEAPYVWARLASLYLDWGDALFRDGDTAAAVAVYERVVTMDGGEPASTLYALAGLKPATDAARAVIAQLNEDATPVETSPAIAAVVLDVWAQLAKIKGGLDFWGHWAANVPIWTFEYLQAVAESFCRLAVSAERDAMSFWEKADAGALTRVQLQLNVAQARAEREAALRQVDAVRSERDAFQAAERTANLRAENARVSAADYADKSWEWTLYQAMSAQLAAGGNPQRLNHLADQFLAGWTLRGSAKSLSAPIQLAGARLQRDYEVGALHRQAAELDAAAAQATKEREAATARVDAATASARASAVRVDGARQMVAAFDDQRFTPDVWNRLGEKMNHLAQRYLTMALDVAKRMQRAYNFENDTERAIIKPDYSSDAVQGLLAADTLMADIQAFTYDLVTSAAPKPQPVRQTISLAERYPSQFETQLRRTGRMEFETGVDDFDVAYPGTYAGRITHVEVTVDGIVPARGISGTLTNHGISHYRVPSAAWAEGGTGLKHRVQNRETLVLSDYDVRGDALVTDNDRRRRRVFEGAGVASSWTLELPRGVNDLDYGAVTDVHLDITYEARFDPDLRSRVLDELSTRPHLHDRQRPIPLRWLFPDAFFAFYATGRLEFSLDQDFFPHTHHDPRLTGVGLVVVTTPQQRAEGVALDVATPGGTAASAMTLADGTSDAAALAAAAAGPVLGDYRIELKATDNPGWVSDGQLALDDIDNIALVLSYSFTPRV